MTFWALFVLFIPVFPLLSPVTFQFFHNLGKKPSNQRKHEKNETEDVKKCHFISLKAEREVEPYISKAINIMKK